jgi:RecA-family ATPase
LIAGPPKIGKSYLALQLALAVAQGRPWMGRATTQGRVLYLQLDTPHELWRERLRELAEAGEDLSGPLYFVHPADQPLVTSVLQPEGRAWLESAVREADPDLVIVDVLRELHTADEDSSTSMKTVGDALRAVFSGRSLLLLHHARKPTLEGGADDPVISSRGSSYLPGRMDAVWLLQRQQIRVVSRFDPDTTYRAERDPDTGLWRFPDAMSRLERVRQCLDLCREHPDLPHEELWLLARSRGLVRSRREYERALEGWVCVHVDGGGA